MRPASSVILLTTLIGAGQGLFLALFGTECLSALHRIEELPRDFYFLGSMLSLAFLGAGLLASFFHLGHPERAWRAAAMWRTSWLSREVIVLPALMATIAVYAQAHVSEFDHTLAIGGVAAALVLLLFICTAMIYACLRFLQEWASWLTLVNYTLLGCASGFALAAAYASLAAPPLATMYGGWALVITLVAFAFRLASLARNARIKHKSTVQTAVGIKHPRITQRSQGFMGGSFNTREFFHGHLPEVVNGVKWGFLLLAFVIPTLMLAGGIAGAGVLLVLAFPVQYAGLLAERWFFFAQARHPQNLYYQMIS